MLTCQDRTLRGNLRFEDIRDEFTVENNHKLSMKFVLCRFTLRNQTRIVKGVERITVDLKRLTSLVSVTSVVTKKIWVQVK